MIIDQSIDIDAPSGIEPPTPPWPHQDPPERTYEEVADILHLTPASVRMIERRAFAKLRRKKILRDLYLQVATIQEHAKCPQ